MGQSFLLNSFSCKSEKNVKLKKKKFLSMSELILKIFSFVCVIRRNGFNRLSLPISRIKLKADINDSASTLTLLLQLLSLPP